MSETLWHSEADPGGPRNQHPRDAENADVAAIRDADENSGESGGVLGEVSGRIGKVPDEGSTRANATGLGGSHRPWRRSAGMRSSRTWSSGPSAPGGGCLLPRLRNWSGPGMPGRPSDTSAARSANGPAAPATRSGRPRHSAAPGQFGKLDAIAVLTGPLIPAPPVTICVSLGYGPMRAMLENTVDLPGRARARRRCMFQGN